MNYNFLRIIPMLFGFLFFISSSCNKLDLERDVPLCLQNKIDKIRKGNVNNPPSEVWKWIINGKTYYYITSDCCDQYNYLYGEDCDIVCAPDGGLSGNGDGNCFDTKEITTKTLVWKDSRD